MAKNREPVKPVESQSESGEEENDEGSSEEVGSQESDSEAEQTQAASQKKSQPPIAAKSQQPPPQQQAPSSSDEEESESEFESESDAPDSNARPLASKPNEESQKPSNGARKARSKPNASEPVTPTKSAAAKRPAEDTGAKNAKKTKKTAEPETSEKKSNLFQRLWSEDDEIVILKGMIGYSSKYKSDPISDLNAFHDFIKSSLHIDVTRVQLQDKIRRLKKKYENNKNKEKEGKDRIFSKPHEQKAYDLSKLIWGNGTGKENGAAKVVASPKANGSVARKAASKKVNAEDVKDVKNAVVVSGQEEKSLSKRLNSTSVGATTEERMLIAGGEYFGSGQGLDKEEDWQKLRVEELQLYVKQLEVRVAQTKLVLEVMMGKDQ